MKQLIFSFSLLFLSTPTFAYNFVANGGFETYQPEKGDHCQSNLREKLSELAAPWFGQSTDLYVDCGYHSNGQKVWGVPTNSFGIISPRPHSDGAPNRNFAGFATLVSNQSYEYVMTTLEKNLDPGIEYDIGYYVATGRGHPHYPSGIYNSIDLKFSPQPLRSNDAEYWLRSLHSITPDVKASPDDWPMFVSRVTGQKEIEVWKKVSGKYTANGNERYATIGVFNPLLMPNNPNDLSGDPLIYMYLDDVSVSCQSKPKLKIKGQVKETGTVQSFCSLQDVEIDGSESANHIQGYFLFEEANLNLEILSNGSKFKLYASIQDGKTIPFPLSFFMTFRPEDFHGNPIRVTYFTTCDGKDFTASDPKWIQFPLIQTRVRPQSSCVDVFPLTIEKKDPYHVFSSASITLENSAGTKIGTQNLNHLAEYNTFDLSKIFSGEASHRQGQYTAKMNFQCGSQSVEQRKSYEIFAPDSKIAYDHEVLDGKPARFEVIEPKVAHQVQWNFQDPDRPSGTELKTLQNIGSQQGDPHVVYRSWQSSGQFPFSAQIDFVPGCRVEHKGEIRVAYDTLFIPTAFTPNGDGNNDSFGPEGRDEIVTRFEVYDRWGQKVFQAQNVPAPAQEIERWQGTDSQGKIFSSDSYLFQIEHHHSIPRSVNGDRAPKMKSGQVMLIR